MPFESSTSIGGGAQKPWNDAWPSTDSCFIWIMFSHLFHVSSEACLGCVHLDAAGAVPDRCIGRWLFSCGNRWDEVDDEHVWSD